VTTGLAARTRADFRMAWRPTLAFHVGMQLLGVAIFTPLIGWIAGHIVSSTGEAVISNFDLASFTLSLRGALFVLVVAALTLGLLFAEFAGLSWLSGHAIARRPVTVASTIGVVIRNLPRLIALSARVFVRLLLLLLPFLAVAAALRFGKLAGHDINYYLAENPPEWQRAKLIVAALGIGYAVLAAWQLARWLYAVPILLYEGVSPSRALARSAEMTRGRLAAIVLPLVGWWLAITAVAIVLTLAGREVSDSALGWAGIDLRRVLPLVSLFLAVSLAGGLVYSALQLAGHQFLVTRLYAEQLDPGRWTVPASLETSEEQSRGLARPAVLATLALLALAIGVAAFLVTRLDLKSDVAITAHRGASLGAPENTMSAFRAALEAGANYVELDVQRTRDGEIIVLHDGDFMRMGGDPRKVADLAAQEIAGIDIGRRYDTKFTGEHAPLLSDVIALARGHMKINVELKYNVPDPGLVPAVVDLLRRELFLGQVVITSLDYSALKQVESLEPGLPTGHIVTAAVGDVAKTSADFVSLNSARATPALVSRAHRAGKKVHVWTVDKPEVMLRMIERDVDNIITNDPALLARVMRERNALSAPEMLGLRLRILFGKAPLELTSAEAVPQL
jgi:glycerophosphoryl diester phosphodiesterase